MHRNEIIKKEELFHDQWAQSIDISTVNVNAFGVACTPPDIKHIISALGDLRGKKILEIGCGFGEASVFFTKHGAKVTASDLSRGMLDVVIKVAHYHNVNIETLQCSTSS